MTEDYTYFIDDEGQPGRQDADPLVPPELLAPTGRWVYWTSEFTRPATLDEAMARARDWVRDGVTVDEELMRAPNPKPLAEDEAAEPVSVGEVEGAEDDG